jgi:hypothetical protein
MAMATTITSGEFDCPDCVPNPAGQFARTSLVTADAVLVECVRGEDVFTTLAPRIEGRATDVTDEPGGLSSKTPQVQRERASLVTSNVMMMKSQQYGRHPMRVNTERRRPTGRRGEPHRRRRSRR